MERIIGTTVRGLIAPIIRENDDIAGIATDVLMNFYEKSGVEPEDRDILALTESIVARAQGNYASCDDISRDVKEKFPEGNAAVIFPILSRNRFAICLKGIARGLKKITLMFSYPSDEVGNHLITLDMLDATDVNPWTDTLSLDDFREKFGFYKHPFTGIDYIEYYKELIEKEGCKCEVIFSNNAEAILKYEKNVICCDIHTRTRTKKILEKKGGEKIITLSDILNQPSSNHGFNDNYGLLGSNKATEEEIKLFPNNCQPLVEDIQNRLREKTCKNIEVMIYGDGAFKDPMGKIWELADPVVSPGYTKGLEGTPNEVKIKYLADNNFKDLSGENLKKAVKEHISHKNSDLTGMMESQGTTPRRLTDLIGSLCDLTSGSGDKGTPIVYIQGYFDNYSK